MREAFITLQSVKSPMNGNERAPGNYSIPKNNIQEKINNSDVRRLISNGRKKE
jgi:hypothetical protein